jgi:alkanesulfonate monooxygenase SsuD/methylene tetrahydromethanopterin reductase-like flavin-dependent oxidoreductase (luciferase family)
MQLTSLPRPQGASTIARHHVCAVDRVSSASYYIEKDVKDQPCAVAMLRPAWAMPHSGLGIDLRNNRTDAPVRRMGGEISAKEVAMSAPLRFNAMHFMPYAHLPENHKDHKSLWVNFSNKHYDPRLGHELYDRYLRELVLADELGYDAIVVNEHHNTVYSMMATPNLIAAALVPQTKNAKICVWGTPPNLMLPNRLAEEYAILDVMSQGRLEVAFPLGTGMEYWANPVNPATARERFREGLKIILQAWTQDGPTTHYGEFYTYRFLNPWPRPYQKPHPPCYIVGTGSPETIEIAAELGFGYASVFVTQQRAYELNENLRQRAAHYGHTMRPDQFPLLTFVYVAETQEQAEKEYVEHLERFFSDCLRTTPQYLAPPGYLSVEQLKTRAAMADKLHGGFNFEAISQSFFIAVGSAEKVANQLGEWAQRMKTNHLNNVMHVADMPHWKTVKNLTLFAEEVIPRLRTRAGSAQRVAAE